MNSGCKGILNKMFAVATDAVLNEVYIDILN